MEMNPKISAVVMARNEETNLPDCLESIAWVDEIIVVDNESTDRTGEIARAAGCKVFVHRMESYSFAGQRNFGIDHCSNDWVLIIDADQRIPPSLREEILTRLRTDEGRHTAYSVLWLNFLMGSPLNNGGYGARYHWGQGARLHLFLKDKWRYTPERPMHERLVGEGTVGCLHHSLHHHPDPNINKRFERTLEYAFHEAEMHFRSGRRVKWHDFVWRPPLEFVKRFIYFRGFLDGMVGWIMAWCRMIEQFLICSYLYEMQQAKQGLEVRVKKCRLLWRVS